MSGGGSIPDRRVDLGDLTRKEFRERLDSGVLRAAIVPIGSTEQHDEHLMMLHDTTSAVLVARLAALALYPSVIVAPPVSVGISEHWMEHRGTLTVRAEIFGEYVFDVCDSLRRGGLRQILVLNGHAGNITPMQERWDAYRERSDLPLRFQSYWDFISADDAQRLLQTGRFPGHASEFETAIARAAFPHAIDQAALDHEEARLATADSGQVLINIAVSGTVGLLRQMLDTNGSAG